MVGLELIRMLISIDYIVNLKLYQMGVKIVFLNGHLEEEVYAAQSKGFQNPHYPNYILKQKKNVIRVRTCPKSLV